MADRRPYSLMLSERSLMLWPEGSMVLRTLCLETSRRESLMSRMGFICVRESEGMIKIS